MAQNIWPIEKNHPLPVAVTLSYNVAGRVLYVSPVSLLPKGWLYALMVTTAGTDRAGPALQSDAQV